MRDLFAKTTARYILHAKLLLRAAPGRTALCAVLTALSGGAVAFSMIASGWLIGSLAHSRAVCNIDLFCANTTPAPARWTIIP